jgi:hypothetical protein
MDLGRAYYLGALVLMEGADDLKEETMRLIRAMFLFMAVCLPTTWTLAHAADEGGASGGGEMKDAKKKGKKKKKDEGDMGKGDKGEMDKK